VIPLKPWRGLRTQSRSLACVAALWLASCATTGPVSKTVPLCPVASVAVADGFDRVLDQLDETGDRDLAAFVAHFEELHHYCAMVLPAWRDG